LVVDTQPETVGVDPRESQAPKRKDNKERMLDVTIALFMTMIIIL
jgi:hypothetical protein